MQHENFIQTLIKELPKSDNEQRDIWARRIIGEQIAITELIPLLELDRKIALRTLWLFSQVAFINPDYLRPELWTIYQSYVTNKIDGGEVSISNQWLICGIPVEFESESIDQLFAWITASSVNKTTKLRAKKALEKVSLKYPEMDREIQLYLNTQQF
jgi:hypothetical protein